VTDELDVAGDIADAMICLDELIFRIDQAAIRKRSKKACRAFIGF
jgi:hypothetical protein